MISVNNIFIGGKIYNIKPVDTNSGKPMAMFSVRVFEKYGEKEAVNWFDCICFSKTAEILLKYGKDDRECFIQGKAQVKDKDNGGHVFTVIANSVQFLGDKI